MIERSAAVVTVSDGVSAGTRADRSGDVASFALEEAGFAIVERKIVPDAQSEILDCLLELVSRRIQLICTTGGTGFGPRDVTPEATMQLIERPAPGLAELMRSEGLKETRHAALSRAVAGISQESLIINLPGSPRGAKTSLAAMLDVIPHALMLIAGQTGHTSDDGINVRSPQDHGDDTQETP